MKIELKTIKDANSPAIAEILAKIESKRSEAASSGDEDLANNCWREAEALKLNTLYIQAFDKIKSRKHREAWYDLDRCEINSSIIKKNSDTQFFVESRCHFIRNQVTKWQSLYPYCVFVSPGFKVGYYTCSICGHKIRPRSRCPHTKGKLYNGTLCHHEAHDVEVLEISLVTKPVQKYSVMHNDETLDFSLIDHLSDLLENAFDDWDANWTRQKFPIERFAKIRPGDECPCKSGKRFEECCIGKNEISIPHVDFLLSKNIPKEKARVRFPY